MGVGGGGRRVEGFEGFWWFRNDSLPFCFVIDSCGLLVIFGLG